MRSTDQIDDPTWQDIHDRDKLIEQLRLPDGLTPESAKVILDTHWVLPVPLQDVLGQVVFHVHTNDRIIVVDLHPSANSAHAHLYVRIGQTETAFLIHGWPPLISDGVQP